MTCPNCGAGVSEQMKFCVSCGFKLAAPVLPSAAPDEIPTVKPAENISSAFGNIVNQSAEEHVFAQAQPAPQTQPMPQVQPVQQAQPIQPEPFSQPDFQRTAFVQPEEPVQAQPTQTVPSEIPQGGFPQNTLVPPENPFQAQPTQPVQQAQPIQPEPFSQPDFQQTAFVQPEGPVQAQPTQPVQQAQPAQLVQPNYQQPYQQPQQPFQQMPQSVNITINDPYRAGGVFVPQPTEQHLTGAGVARRVISLLLNLAIIVLAFFPMFSLYSSDYSVKINDYSVFDFFKIYDDFGRQADWLDSLAKLGSGEAGISAILVRVFMIGGPIIYFVPVLVMVIYFFAAIARFVKPYKLDAYGNKLVNHRGYSSGPSFLFIIGAAIYLALLIFMYVPTGVDPSSYLPSPLLYVACGLWLTNVIINIAIRD